MKANHRPAAVTSRDSETDSSNGQSPSQRHRGQQMIDDKECLSSERQLDRSRCGHADSDRLGRRRCEVLYRDTKAEGVEGPRPRQGNEQARCATKRTRSKRRTKRTQHGARAHYIHYLKHEQNARLKGKEHSLAGEGWVAHSPGDYADALSKTTKVCLVLVESLLVGGIYHATKHQTQT
jgi:hypothetical protein